MGTRAKQNKTKILKNKQKNKLEGYYSNPEDDGLDQCGRSVGGKKCSSGYISKVKPPGFIDM